jgi:hypothetical protein
MVTVWGEEEEEDMVWGEEEDLEGEEILAHIVGGTQTCLEDGGECPLAIGSNRGLHLYLHRVFLQQQVSLQEEMIQYLHLIKKISKPILRS